MTELLGLNRVGLYSDCFRLMRAPLESACAGDQRGFHWLRRPGASMAGAGTARAAGSAQPWRLTLMWHQRRTVRCCVPSGGRLAVLNDLLKTKLVSHHRIPGFRPPEPRVRQRRQPGRCSTAPAGRLHRAAKWKFVLAPGCLECRSGKAEAMDLYCRQPQMRWRSECQDAPRECAT
jgi:hypothetical protein